MQKYLTRLPQDLQDLIRTASDVAFDLKMPICLVGGFVRDLILEVKNLDLDFVVEEDGIKFTEELTRRLRARLVMHKRFGTATIFLGHLYKIDVATARSEIYPEPASLPLVTSGTIKDDLKRRDFTINAMAISISRDGFGKLIDFFGGQHDLKNKRVRVLHELSFIDDPTRILRAIRFEKRYNFKIEPVTLKSLKAAVKLKMLEKVEPQRVRDDLILVLKERDPLREIKRIQELCGFGFIAPGLSATKKTCVLIGALEKEIAWFKRAFPRRRELDLWLLYLLFLIEPLNLSATKKFCLEFALRKGETKRILSFKKITPGFIKQLIREKLKPAKIFSLLEPLSYEVILAAKAKYKNRLLQKRIADFFEIYNGMRVSIRGEDLHRLGMAPGPYYKKIFTCVLKEKLNGKIKSRTDELALIQKLINKKWR